MSSVEVYSFHVKSRELEHIHTSGILIVLLIATLIKWHLI